MKVSCENSNCQEFIKVGDITEHEVTCKKRGSYDRQAVSISKSRSKALISDAQEILNTLINWCDNHKVKLCDFLLYALSRNIHKEVPALQDSVQKLFKRFLNEAVADDDTITPMMALALKLDTNLSHRQYCTLASKKLLGKLPYIGRVRKVMNDLDPGNVSYKVVSKVSGEVIEEHFAVPKSGIINVDNDIGHMSFGDLNINVHGYRSKLKDTIAKLFEEVYPEVAAGLNKVPEALDDPNKKIKLFAKVSFDGTSAPLKSEKGSSRVPVGNWLRGTLCIVQAQVNCV